MNKWHINIREEGSCLLDALALRVPSAPRGFLRQLIKKQRILINGENVKDDINVQRDQVVSIKTSQRWKEILQNCPLQPEQILYEDTQCLIINKPAGLATHRAQGHEDNLLLRVQGFLRLRKESFVVAPVQRLDIGTSGAVLIGKGKDAISKLGQLIMSGEITKRYLALVRGKMPLSGTLSTPVIAKGNIKTAFTKYIVIGASETHSLLSLELETGRRHQIRQQLATLRHPIVGDARYGDRPSKTVTRPMLHCHQLIFRNPVSGQPINIICPPAADFNHLAHSYGFDESLTRNPKDKIVPYV
jgi:RluA family pseudouridine synthase